MRGRQKRSLDPNRHGAAGEARPLITSFNLEGPHKQDAWASIVLILIVISFMLAFSLLLESVSDLALKPMERMPGMVRQIAASVFATADHMKRASEDFSDADSEFSEVVDVESASEMLLLGY